MSCHFERNEMELRNLNFILTFMEWKITKIKLILNIQKTDKQTPSIRIVSIFLILIFSFVPLAEIVIDFDYHFIESYPTYFCISDFSFETLSFKEIK